MSFRSLFFRSASPRRSKQRRGNPRASDRPLAKALLRVESLETRTMLTTVVSGFALAAGSDSGVVNQAATFVDNVTNVTNPTVTGTATAGSMVSVYVENDGGIGGVLNPGVNTLLLGTATATASGTWTVTSPVSLNDASVSSTIDSERTLFAQDSADVATDYAQLNIFLETAPPTVSSVTFDSNGSSVGLAPSGPTPPTAALDVTFQSPAIRTADFPGSTSANSAINFTLGTDSSNYTLTGANGGTIPITSVNFTDETAIGGPGVSVIKLGFAAPLPDDTYTLTVSDNLMDDAGNALDGLADGTPGSGNYTTTFKVQGGLSLGVQMSQAIQSTDLQGATGGGTTTYPFYKPSDTVFTGNFQDSTSGTADGFSKLAAFGMNNGQYRFLFQSDTDGSLQTITSASGVPFPAGLPVAGNFDGLATTGDEVGIFTGKAFDLYSINLLNGADTASLIKTVNWPVQGYPVAGDFNGDGMTDLATWSNGNFYVSYAANGFSEIDAIIPLSFPGGNARPVAADVDGTTNAASGLPISDLGLWVPNGVPSTSATANWYFLPSGGTPLSQKTSFIPENFQFGSSIGVPITGVFSATSLSGVVTPAAVFAAPNQPASSFHAAKAAPLTSVTVTSVTVNGTTGNDNMQLTAGKSPNTWVLTVNGKSQNIGSSVTTLDLNGLGGNNALSILGTGKDETAQIWPTKAIFHSGNLTVTATNFNNTTVNGGHNSTDKVSYHELTGGNWFVAVPSASSLTVANDVALALNFKGTLVVAPPGKGNNIANFFPSKTAAAVGASVSSSVVSFVGQGVAAESAFSSKVQIYNQAGAVVKTILPTPSYATPAQIYATTRLSPASRANIAAAASIENNTKSSNTPLPAAVDAVLASYGS